MIIVTFGITVLLVMLFPIGNQFIAPFLRGMYGPLFGTGSPASFYIAVILTNYVPAIIVAAMFVKKSQIKQRLPEIIPGRKEILIGLVLLCAYIVPRIFASTIPGGGAAFAFSQFESFIRIPANIFITIGVVKVLLAAQPSPTPQSSETR